jgi:hypothetical protein
MRSIYLGFLFFIQFCTGQNTKPSVFDFNKVYFDLRTNQQKSIYYKDLDYHAILFLDQNIFPILKKIKPEYYHLNKPEKGKRLAILKIKTNLKEIKQFINDSILVKNVFFELEGVNNYNMKSIYFKSPNKAFYTISGTDMYGYYWLNSYGFLLEKGVLNIYKEYSLVE